MERSVNEREVYIIDEAPESINGDGDILEYLTEEDILEGKIEKYRERGKLEKDDWRQKAERPYSIDPAHDPGLHMR
jgi:hypothetical protein